MNITQHPMKKTTQRPIFSSGLTSVLLVTCLFTFNGNTYAEPSDKVWPIVKEAFFSKREIAEAPFMTLTGPRRAESGAQVPITLTVDQSKGSLIKNVYLIVDANPIPLAATYHLTESLGNLQLSTRIRMETDSYIHAIGETVDGKLFMTNVAIRAAGGCGGTVDGNEAEIRAAAGKIKLQVENPVKIGVATPVTFMIKHPMRTGLQRDLVSQGFVPAFYIQKAAFTLNDKPLMSVDFGVGTSEDPYLRFDMTPDAAGKLEVKATDNEGKEFARQIEIRS
jgi:sulfur-oxidizing protein SoxY